MADKISVSYDANIDDMKRKLEELIALNNRLKRSSEDVSGAYSKAGSSISSANASVAQSTTVINNYNNSVNNTTNNVTRMGSAVNNASKQVSEFDGLLSRVASRMAAYFAIDSLVNFGKSVVDTTRKVELMQNRLSFVFGSVTGGREAFDRLYDTSQKLGIGFQELGDGFSSFAIAAKMAGFSAKESEGMFTKVAIALRGAGANSLQTQRSFYALQQMLSKGVVAAEELRRQLGEALPGASDLMTKAYNRLHPAQQVTNLGFTKLLENGKIISAEILPEFARVLEETFAPAVAGKSGSLDASLTRVTNSWERFKLSLGEANFQTIISFTTELTEAIDLLNLSLTNERLSLLERIAIAFDGIFNPGKKDLFTAQLYTEKVLNQELRKRQSIIYALSGEYENIGDASKASTIAIEMLNEKAASSQAEFNRLTLEQLEEKRESIAAELKDTEHLLSLGKAGTDQLRVKGKAYQIILDRMEEIRIKNKETEKQEGDAIAAAKERVALEETRLLKTTEGTTAYYNQLIKLIQARKDLVKLEKAGTPNQMGLDLAKLDKDLEKARKMVESFDPNVAEVIEEGVYVPSVESLQKLSKDIKDLTVQMLQDSAAEIEAEIQLHAEGTDRRLELEKALVMAKARLAAKSAEIQGKSVKEIEAIFAKANIDMQKLDTDFNDGKKKEAEDYAEFYKRLQDGLDGYEGNSLDKRLKAIREYYGKLIDEAKDYGRSKEEIDALAANRDKALFEENVKEVGKFVNAAGDLYNQFTQIQEMEFNNQKTALDNKLAQGLISEEQYNAELADIEKKQFEQNKKTQKVNVLINSASAIVRAFSELGPIGGALAAFAIGAMAIKQMSLIDSAQFPEGFKEGVIDLNGPGTGTSDSIPARLSRGESVMTADETKRYKPVLQAIRDNNFEEFVSKRYIDAMSGTKRSFADNVGASIELNNFEMIDAIRKNKSVKIANWDDFDKVLRKPRTAHKVHRRRAW
jgi:tape measure domain-containing protein